MNNNAPPFLNSPTSPYLLAEIGINHNGDIEIAKRLIDAAYGARWDCVKFQKRNPDICVPEAMKGQRRNTPWGEMSYLEYKKEIEFEKEEYDYIDWYCKQKSIAWTASIWDPDSLEFLLNYNIPFIKLPSAMLTNSSLLDTACESQKPIILSTGMSTLDEIDIAVNIMERKSASYILLHCNSTYPAPNAELNLQCIESFRSRYGCFVGYSGHEYGVNPSVTAAHLGAVVIERHITLDRTMWGTDQSASLEPHAMDLLAKRIRAISLVMGDGVKRVTEEEYEVRKKLGHIQH